MAVTTCPNYSSRLTIDLGAIRANYYAMSERVAPARCAAVVKADAYGLGIHQVAKTLLGGGCRDFFVAHLHEALSLFEAVGIGSRIFILNGLDPGCEALCAHWGFLPVLNTPGQLLRWRHQAMTQGCRLSAALQIDTGMSRLGIDAETAAGLVDEPGFADDVSLQLIMTHLSCADEAESPENLRQLSRFARSVAQLENVPASIANSAGSYISPAFHHDLVRPGIALFGGPDPSAGRDMRPVVGLEARVVQIRDIPASTGVGYGHDYIAPVARRLATVGIGYADGLPRTLGNAGALWHVGQRLPIVGRVSMDSLTVDISELADGSLAEGDFVEVIGPSQSLCELAGDAGTISYEILTRLGTRHQRIYLSDDHTQIFKPGSRR